MSKRKKTVMDTFCEDTFRFLPALDADAKEYIDQQLRMAHQLGKTEGQQEYIQRAHHAAMGTV